MNTKFLTATVAGAGLLIGTLSCNMQPGGEGQPPTSESSAMLSAEPGVRKDGLDRKVRKPRRQRDPNRKRRKLEPIKPIVVSGPKETAAAALPKADQQIAIFHSANVEGELDPCG